MIGVVSDRHRDPHRSERETRYTEFHSSETGSFNLDSRARTIVLRGSVARRMPRQENPYYSSPSSFERRANLREHGRASYRELMYGLSPS